MQRSYAQTRSSLSGYTKITQLGCKGPRKEFARAFNFFRKCGICAVQIKFFAGVSNSVVQFL